MRNRLSARVRGFFMREKGAGKGQQHSEMRRAADFAALFSRFSSPARPTFKPFVLIGPEWGSREGIFVPFCTHCCPFVQNGTDCQTPMAGRGLARHADPQVQLGSTDLAPLSLKSFASQKSPTSTCEKYEMYSVFSSLTRAAACKLSTPLVPLSAPLPMPPGLWWRASEARRQGVSHGYATSKAPFARPSIKGVHHAGMHA